jgi:hypothetical protein
MFFFSPITYFPLHAWWYPIAFMFFSLQKFNFCLWLQILKLLFLEWVEDFWSGQGWTCWVDVDEEGRPPKKLSCFNNNTSIMVSHNTLGAFFHRSPYPKTHDQVNPNCTCWAFVFSFMPFPFVLRKSNSLCDNGDDGLGTVLCLPNTYHVRTYFC